MPPGHLGASPILRRTGVYSRRSGDRLISPRWLVTWQSTCVPNPQRGRDPSQGCARAKAVAKGLKEVAKEKWPTIHRPTNYAKYPFPTSGPYWSSKRNHKALVLHKSRTQGTNTRRRRGTTTGGLPNTTKIINLEQIT
ncbi:uncharacterized protein [Drosophila kikkawai]|uniref:Uncharacterized protein n=1 Tax=Drosophila kikkawai TaxID=30033 RepID=A0ABM4GBV2_DROKI